MASHGILAKNTATEHHHSRRPKKYLDCDSNALEEVIANFPMRINPYFLNLIQYPGDPIWRQAVPHPDEIRDYICECDPLGEENLSPVRNLVHKYPDRALFLVAKSCAMYSFLHEKTNGRHKKWPSACRVSMKDIHTCSNIRK